MSVTTWFRQQPCFGTLASLSTESLPRARRYWCTVWVTEAGGEPCFYLLDHRSLRRRQEGNQDERCVIGKVALAKL